MNLIKANPEVVIMSFSSQAQCLLNLSGDAALIVPEGVAELKSSPYHKAMENMALLDIPEPAAVQSSYRVTSL